MTARHPDHDAIRQTIHGWYHDAFDDMGFLSEHYPWGTVWNTNQVQLTPFDPRHLTLVLQKLRDRYSNTAYNLNFEDLEFADRLEPHLVGAAFRPLPDELFLAHTGAKQLSEESIIESEMGLEPVTRENAREFSHARLEAFAEPGETPSNEAIEAEYQTRSAELGGSGRGRIAKIDGERCGAIWWYEEERDGWISYLATHAAYRKRGVATRLIRECLEAKSRRSSLINVVENNKRARALYEKMGFRDEVYRKRRFRYEPKLSSHRNTGPLYQCMRHLNGLWSYSWT